MTREKLNDRRPSVTERLTIVLDGKEKVVLVTVGFADDEMTKPREVFCADWKAGTAIHSIVMDACVLVSRLLQHGISPAELFGSLCRPPSLIGSIVELCAKNEGGFKDG